MKIRFLGAARTVTGSCFHLRLNGRQFLVDCGMHQGKDSREVNSASFAFNPREIEAMFLTHAHIDHSGLIPRLVKEGFAGSIITTAATADLASVMLLDSAHIQEKDAEWLTRKSFRTGEDVAHEPLYTAEDARAALGLFDRKEYGKTGHLGKGLSYRFNDAGHILGSGTLELWFQDGPAEKKIVFSGDIGKKGNPIINDPDQIKAADYVVMESTYGNRLHKPMEESISELAEAINTTVKSGGNVVIPSFAVGRTQDILYILNKLAKEKRIGALDVYIDSPLAEEATKVYLAHPEVYDEDARRTMKERKTNGLRIHFTESVAESQRINAVKSGAVIIAGSGMCEGGRVQHHLKHNLWRRECSVVFVGFQAEGTLGREIVSGASKVIVLGEPIAVRSKIYTINGFSAHADRDELLEWLGGFGNKPEVFIVHGEESVSLDFAAAVGKRYGFVTRVPSPGEEFDV
ncbi:MAG TPA: MBL fold metallo-hydrolase [Dissulfurispiraceae bacterium]|nr:MBL fold metallo-hydrolase [Dissulfurispiraceae bacterium]